jgi:acyl-homoserine-lactone acylase
VLAAWDGRSDSASVGNHIFEEFVERLPTDGVWVVPFSTTDPVGTPRTLNVLNPQVIRAMRNAIAHLREQGVPMDATWGSLQVAGDRGAAPIPIGGGSGAAGNANAIASRNPEQNADTHHAPVTYGSSHIQAVAFLPEGGLSARTILTYSQYDDPGSPHSVDQTRLFSEEKWVAFPFTPAEVAAARTSRRMVTG